MHRLLQRELRKACLDGATPPELEYFLAAVNDAYESFETDRKMLERSLEISSQELLTTNHSLRESEQILGLTLQSVADGVLAVSNEGRLLHFNKRFVDLWRMPSELVESREDDLLLEFAVSQVNEPEEFLEKIRELNASDQDGFDVVSFRDSRIVERYSSPLIDRGVVTGRVWSFRDITQQHSLEEQLRHQAFHDPLTDLANRARFFDRLAHALERSRRGQTPVFVLFLDVDNFKAINDSLGHTIGDHTIVAVASRITRGIAAGDTAARLGGDEFGIILEDRESLEDARKVADHILDLIRIPIQLDDHEVVIDASIGIAFGDWLSTSEELVRNADIAMYAAKGRGKGRIQTYERGMHTQLSERQSLIADLRHALENKELLVKYQPSISLASGRIAGAEALLRWNHPTKGVIPPARFIPLAEETNLIQEIGEFVLRDACSLIADWQARLPDAHLLTSVNVSPKQIHDRSFVGKVNGIIQAAGIDPSWLVLEITESAVLDDPERALQAINALKDLGIKLALDDFGTGYSSLSYLKQFPIDILKIDKSFISDIYISERETALTGATIALGQKLKLRIVAEGIERNDQLEHLKSLDCELGQGFLFSEPLLRSELDQYMEPMLIELGDSQVA